MPMGVVPVENVREVVLSTGMSKNEMARRLGWTASSGRPDVGRVNRTLGLARNGSHHSKRLTEQMVMKIANALDIDPLDLGM